MSLALQGIENEFFQGCGPLRLFTKWLFKESISDFLLFLLPVDYREH